MVEHVELINRRGAALDPVRHGERITPANYGLYSGHRLRIVILDCNVNATGVGRTRGADCGKANANVPELRLQIR